MPEALPRIQRCGATNEMQLREVWRGDLPLGQAFWEYAIAYGTIANLVATGAAIAAATLGLPDVIAVCLFLSPLPYILAAVVGVLRSANNTKEQRNGRLSPKLP